MCHFESGLISAYHAQSRTVLLGLNKAKIYHSPPASSPSSILALCTLSQSNQAPSCSSCRLQHVAFRNSHWKHPVRNSLADDVTCWMEVSRADASWAGEAGGQAWSTVGGVMTARAGHGAARGGLLRSLPALAALLGP